MVEIARHLGASAKFTGSGGAIIGTFDALSGGIAGRALASNPIADLMLQTSVQGFMGGAGEASAQLATTGEVDMNEVIFEAVGELATTPIEVAGIGGRPLVARIRDMTDSARAEATVDGMDQIAEALQESPLTQRAPETAAQHMANVFENNGMDAVYMPIEAVQAAGLDVDALGVADQVAQAEQFGGDVRIEAREFSQHILQNPDVYEAVKEHIRVDENSLTRAEAAEVNEETNAAFERAAADTSAAVEGEVSLTTDEVVSRDTTATPAMEIAEHEAGVAALFQDAKEAGFNETQYASYIEAIKRSRTQAQARAERARLKREEKRLDTQYQETREQFRPEVEETVSQLPTYNAMNGIGVDRLSYESVLEIFQGDVKAMERLPRVQGRRMYAPKGQPGIDANQYADLYGFPGGDTMLFSMMDSPTYEQAVEAELTRRVEEEIPTVIDARGQVQEALEALHAGDQHGVVLAFELARLRQMRGLKKIRRSLIRARARAMLETYRVGRISSTQLEMHQRREGRRAAKALREGDLVAASRHKLNQAVAFEMTRESYKIKDELNRGNKMMRKIQRTKDKKRGVQRGLPVEFREKAQEVLADFQFGNQSSNSRRLQQALDTAMPQDGRQPGEDLRSWKRRVEEEQGIVMELGPTVEESDGRTHWKNLTLQQWRELRNSVQEIVRAGNDANKIRRANEKLGVDEIVADISEGVETNLKKRGPREAADVDAVTDVPAMRTTIDNTNDAWTNTKVNVAGTILNADSLLRAIDGFESLGPAYTYIKGGIDRAYTEGYMPDQVGYMARMNKEARKLVRLFDMFTKTDRNTMWREQDIPGVRQRLTRAQQIGVLLNMGNAENIAALTAPTSDGRAQFTESELTAIVNSASKRDLDFVQGVWDFLATFEPEVRDTVRRRQNRNPTMVEPLALETPHGTYKGGYFPLHYDTDKGILEKVALESFDFEEARSMMLRGGFTASHTADGHTQTRRGSGGRPVKLDPFVINHHLGQLIYDLEMGDAVHDAYKVLHNPGLKRAFERQGAVTTWKALDLWLGDAITGEIHRGGMIERSMRHIRTGTTISRLAFNVSTAMLQPLGLLQTAVQIGKANTMHGLYQLVGGRGQNPKAVYDWVTAQSGFMAERERSFNKDIHDAAHGIANGLTRRIVGGKTADFAADSFFYLIAKAQRFVDVVTWLGARRQGMQMFPGDETKANLHADRMVARAQGTGIFHERTNFERGTISPQIRNTEMVRAWSLFLSYFAAKVNVAWERSKRAQFRENPMEFINYPVDMVMLFMVEGVLAAIIKEGWPEGDDEEVAAQLGQMAVWEGVNSLAAGVPLAREVATASKGFSTGGAIGGFAQSVADAGVQISQGEVDAAAVKAVNNVTGVLFRYPTSQVNKTGQAFFEDTPWNDVKWWEYITGIRYEQTAGK